MTGSRSARRFRASIAIIAAGASAVALISAADATPPAPSQASDQAATAVLGPEASWPLRSLVVDSAVGRVFGIGTNDVVVFNYSGDVIARLHRLSEPNDALLGPDGRLYVSRADEIDVLDATRDRVIERIGGPRNSEIGPFAFAGGRLWAAITQMNSGTTTTLDSTSLVRSHGRSVALKLGPALDLESAGINSRYLYSGADSASYRVSGTHATYLAGSPSLATGAVTMSTGGDVATSTSRPVTQGYQYGVDLIRPEHPRFVLNFLPTPIGSANSVELSPDNQWLVTSKNNAIAIQRWDNPNDNRIIGLGAMSTAVDAAPQVTPDGRMMFFTTTDSDGSGGFEVTFHAYPVDIGNW